MLSGETVYCIYRLCCLETSCVAWRQAVLLGDTVYCLYRLCFLEKSYIAGVFMCIFASFTFRHMLWHYFKFDHHYLHVPSISLFVYNRTVWHHCNTLRVIGSVIKYTINKSLLRKTRIFVSVLPSFKIHWFVYCSTHMNVRSFALSFLCFCMLPMMVTVKSDFFSNSINP